MSELFRGLFATLQSKGKSDQDVLMSYVQLSMSVNKVAAEEYGSDKPIVRKPTDER